MISTKNMNEFKIVDKVVELELKLNKLIEMMERISLFLIDNFYTKEMFKSKRLIILKQNLKELKIL